MNPVQISLMAIFHPEEGFNQIKANRENYSHIPAISIFVLCIIARILSLYLTAYSVSSTDVNRINVITEALMIAVPACAWCVVHYAITTISSGECKLREVFAGLAYSFVPYMIFILPIALFSHLYSESSAGTIHLLEGIVLGYCVLQVILSIKFMNDFSIKKTFGIIVLTIIGIALCAIFVLLFYGLTGQLIRTAYIVAREFIMIYIS